MVLYVISAKMTSTKMPALIAAALKVRSDPFPESERRSARPGLSMMGVVADVTVAL